VTVAKAPHVRRSSVAEYAVHVAHRRLTSIVTARRRQRLMKFKENVRQNESRPRAVAACTRPRESAETLSE
jgi:hypothetical protein